MPWAGTCNLHRSILRSQHSKRRLAPLAGFARVDSTTVGVVRFAILIPLVLLGCSAETATPDEQQAREKAFEESMRGAVLDGHFTLVRQGVDSTASGDSGEGVRLRSERYEIEKVVKRAGDIWTFHARIQYGERDVTLPVPVKLLWAGDTPMVSVPESCFIATPMPGCGRAARPAGICSGESSGPNSCCLSPARRPASASRATTLGYSE